MARSAIVLAGGRASRFGSDKTRALVDGVPLLERVVAVAAPLVDEVLVVGPWAPAGIRHMVEPDVHGGPLAALVFGLHQVPAGEVLVLAADHPWLEPALLQLLLDRLGDGDAAAVVPRDRGGRFQPLLAAYRTSIVTAAAHLVESGQRSMQALLGMIDLAELDERAWSAVDPAALSFQDIDERADLLRRGVSEHPEGGPR